MVEKDELTKMMDEPEPTITLSLETRILIATTGLLQNAINVIKEESKKTQTSMIYAGKLKS